MGEQKVAPEKAGRTFGKVPGMSRPHPQEFMKKNDKREPVAPLATIKREDPSKLVPSSLKTRHRPGVPKADEKPIMNLVTSKNFVVANAVETILAAPKKVSSGAKDFLNKEDYGKVPKYLKSIKADIEAESDYINHIMEQQGGQQITGAPALGCGAGGHDLWAQGEVGANQHGLPGHDAPHEARDDRQGEEKREVRGRAFPDREGHREAQQEEHHGRPKHVIIVSPGTTSYQQSSCSLPSHACEDAPLPRCGIIL